MKPINLLTHRVEEERRNLCAECLVLSVQQSELNRFYLAPTELEGDIKLVQVTKRDT